MMTKAEEWVDNRTMRELVNKLKDTESRIKLVREAKFDLSGNQLVAIADENQIIEVHPLEFMADIIVQTCHLAIVRRESEIEQMRRESHIIIRSHGEQPIFVVAGWPHLDKKLKKMLKKKADRVLFHPYAPEDLISFIEDYLNK